jgi:hypothetical protein
LHGCRDFADLRARPPAEARLLLTEGEAESGAFAAPADRLRPGLGAVLRARVVRAAAHTSEGQRASREHAVFAPWLA